MKPTSSIFFAVLLALAPATAALAQNAVSAEATTVTMGKEWAITVSLNNAVEYTTFQADIAVPEGVTLKENSLVPSDRLSGHTVSTATLADGTIRVVAYNDGNASLFGSSGTLFSLTLAAASEITEAGARATFRNLRFTDVARQETVLDGFYVPLETNTPTGIRSATLNVANGQPVFDLQGRRVLSPRSGGVYIIGGRKVLVR